MKSFLLFICILQIFLNGIAQGVGIGITSPAARLDVTKPGGDTPTVNLRGSVYISHFNFGTVEDTYIRGGKSTSNVILADLGSGKVGLGMPSPGFPLNFSNALGDKISLWGNIGAHYGFGIQSLLFQMHTDLPSADIAFGYGSSGSFTENMRIKGNGNVGIGINNPDFKLDIADRMRIRSGGSGSAGLYLNNNANTTSPAFIGMDDDTHVGFWGSGGGWKFSMNTQTGALKVNGNEGSAGQVMQSNGSGAAATWASSTNTLYNNTGTVSSSTSMTIGSTITFFQLPGMTYTFTTSGNTKVLVAYSVPVHSNSCTFCGASNAYIDIMLDGGRVNRTLNIVANGGDVSIACTKLLSVGGGSHTISLMASNVGPDALFNPCCVFESNLTVQVISQ